MFDAFEQLNGRQREGLGLGLAISKAVVEIHGGTIRVTSAGPGRGTCFQRRAAHGGSLRPVARPEFRFAHSRCVLPRVRRSSPPLPRSI
ncbi:MAG: ATP-binding protein [Gammaproteobacteria bacterium]